MLFTSRHHSKSPLTRTFSTPSFRAAKWFGPLACSVSLLTLCQTVSADDLFWGGSGVWTATSKWSTVSGGPYTSTWVSGSNAFFNVANSTITGSTTSVANITANESVTVTSGGTLTLLNSTINVAAGKTFGFGNQVFATSSAITKAGEGTLTLSGSTAYTGGFTLNAGTVNADSNAALGAGALNINGGTLQFSIAGTRATTVTQVNIGGNFATGSATAGTLTFTAPVALGTATREITVNNTTTSFIGTVSSASGVGITKLGTGALSLAGASANTFDGLTTVTAGTLNLAKTASVDAFAGSLRINGGNVAYSTTIDNQIPDAAKVTISSGGITFGARSETFGTTTAANSGFEMTGGTLTMSSGTVAFANSAVISGGTATLTSSGSLQFNTNLNFSGGTITNSSASNSSNGVALRGGDGTGITYLSSGTGTAAITNTGTGTGMRVSMNTVAGSTTVIEVQDSATVANEMTIAVPITSNANNGNVLQKTGAGQLTLTGASTYTAATTLSAGTMVLDSAGSTTARLGGTTTVSVNGGTLLLANSSGTVSTDRINNAATVRLSGGVFNTGGLSEYGGTAAAPTAGLGTLTLSGTSELNFGSGASVLMFAGSTYESGVLNITGWSGDSASGNGTDRLLFTAAPSAEFLAGISFDGYGSGSRAVSFNDGAFYEVVPTAVPEPATVFAGLALVGLVAGRERKRLRKLLGA